VPSTVLLRHMLGTLADANGFTHWRKVFAQQLGACAAPFPRALWPSRSLALALFCSCALSRAGCCGCLAPPAPLESERGPGEPRASCCLSPPLSLPFHRPSLPRSYPPSLSPARPVSPSRAGLQAFLGHSLALAPAWAQTLHFCLSTGAVHHRTEEVQLGLLTAAASQGAMADDSSGEDAQAAVPFRLTRNLQVSPALSPARAQRASRHRGLAHAEGVRMRAPSPLAQPSPTRRGWRARVTATQSRGYFPPALRPSLATHALTRSGVGVDVLALTHTRRAHARALAPFLRSLALPLHTRRSPSVPLPSRAHTSRLSPQQQRR
jgi:hypothetical protein